MPAGLLLTIPLGQLMKQVAAAAAIRARWAAGDPTLFHKYAGELVALELDVVFAVSTPAVTPLRVVSRTVLIVLTPRRERNWFRVLFEYVLAAK
jgi:hypothetical protein